MRFIAFFLIFIFSQTLLAQGQFFGLGINPQGSTNYYKLTWYPELQLDPFYLGLKNDYYFNENAQYFSKANVHHVLFDHESFYIHFEEKKDHTIAQGLLIHHYSSKPYGSDFFTEYAALDTGLSLYPFSFNYFSNNRTFRVFQAEVATSVFANDDNFHFQIYHLENNLKASNRLSYIDGIGSDLKISFIKFYGEYAQTTANIKSTKAGVALEHPDQLISPYADVSYYDQNFPVYKIDSFYENVVYRNIFQDIQVSSNLSLTEYGLQLKPSQTFVLNVFTRQGGLTVWGVNTLWSVNKNTFLELDYEVGRLEMARRVAKLFMLFEDSSQFSINYEIFFSPTLYEQSYVNVEYLLHF